MNKLIFTLTFALVSTIAFSQTNVLYCGTDEMRINTLKQNPEIAKAVIKRDAQLENFTQNFVQNFQANNQTQKTSTTSATYIIPIVFHVIHNYGAENISDAQLKDGIDMLNKTFRKQRADTASIVSVFKGIHADCDIEFRLAQKDPNGNCHSGINRIASSLTNLGQHDVKNLIHWPPHQYLNVYVVANIPGLAGYCVLPADADTIPLWDGIVLAHNYVGTIGTSNLTQSVAFAHECGHFLNLLHIWGGNNVPGFYYYPCAVATKDCSIDDLVADTPPTIGWQTCNLAGASCGNAVDNVQNAMDYSYCNIMFTQGQKARMHACLNSPIAGRNNLWQTANLIATGVYTTAPLCKADFVSDKKMVCQSNVVTFTNSSYGGTFTSYAWKFQGGTPATSSIANPTVTYASAGSYSVELKVKNGTDSATVVKQNYIAVQTATGTVYPYSEGFETVTSLNGSEWLTNNIDTSNTWQLTNTAFASGNKSAMLNNFSSTLDGKDELYSRAINLSGASTLNVSFKYAFARKDTSNRDQLQLYGLMNCNGTALLRFSSIGSALETVPVKTTAFYPTSASEWKTVTATLPSALFTSGFRLKFVFSRHGGNNIFIDDINIAIDAGIRDLSEDVSLFSIYPNPTNDNCTLRFNLQLPKTLAVTVVNVLGQKVMEVSMQLYNEGENTVPLKTTSLIGGMYFIQLSDGLRTITKPLVINP
jgi:PKD repeat protein